jgi:cyanophycinase
MSVNKAPKGKLVIIGGAEDKGDEYQPEIRNKNKAFEQFEILKELIPPRNGQEHTMEIITTASSEPDEVTRMYRNAFRRIGFDRVGFMHIDNDHRNRNPGFVDRVKKAHTVMFAGGDQFRLATIIGGTDVLEVIKSRYRDDANFVVAGTSAGAMASSTIMIYEGETNEAILKGAVKISSGLGIIDRCLIDTHFIKRGRFGRLAQAVVMNPACIGIGLGEDTALIISKGNIAECRGSGMVIIIDGKKIGHTNIPFAEEGKPICIENLRVHVLSKGNCFKLNERRFVPSKADMRKEKDQELFIS